MIRSSITTGSSLAPRALWLQSTAMPRPLCREVAAPSKQSTSSPISRMHLMEPLDGFLRWDGQRATARIGCQLQTGDRMAIATVLGIKPEQVEIETMPAGGSFGRRGEALSDLRRSWPGSQKRSGRTGRSNLVWTREDDIQGGRYRPILPPPHARGHARRPDRRLTNTS